jgi:ubiquinone/menaquinone biosynthesis C-methylase UbiE
MQTTAVGNQLINPYLLFKKVQLQRGMHVADFGCGRTGHLTFPAALIVGDRGVLYAVDIMKDVLGIVSKRAKDDRLTNVYPVWADVERIGKTAIPEGSLDIVFVVNMLNQSNNRHAVLEEARRLLKSKGRVALVDWALKDKELPFGPERSRFVDFDEINQWAGLRGFVVQERFDVGAYHEGMILYRYDG